MDETRQVLAGYESVCENPKRWGGSSGPVGGADETVNARSFSSSRLAALPLLLKMAASVWTLRTVGLLSKAVRELSLKVHKHLL